MESWLIESSKILEKARNLSEEEKKVFRYFLENISVGDLRAIMELNRKGIKNPSSIIETLVSNGLLESCLLYTSPSPRD